MATLSLPESSPGAVHVASGWHSDSHDSVGIGSGEEGSVVWCSGGAGSVGERACVAGSGKGSGRGDGCGEPSSGSSVRGASPAKPVGTTAEVCHLSTQLLFQALILSLDPPARLCSSSLTTHQSPLPLLHVPPSRS